MAGRRMAKDFLQGGIEILGDSSPECDGEVIVTAAEILKAVGVENIRIDIGTAAYTQALFEAFPFRRNRKDHAEAIHGRTESRGLQVLYRRPAGIGRCPQGPGSPAGPLRALCPDPEQGPGLLHQQRHAQRPVAAGTGL